MSEVRCPFCGNLNATEAEACAVCGSRLHPIRNSSQDEPETSDETPEWLSKLRERAQNEANESESTPAFTSLDDLEEEGVPDWLQSLKDAAAEANGDFADSEEPGPFIKPETTVNGSLVEPVSPFVSGPDRTNDQSWLRELAGLPSEEPEEPEADVDEQAPFVGPVDWARRLANEPIAQHLPEEEPDDSDPISDAEENGELLSRLKSWTGEPAPFETKETERTGSIRAETPAFTLDENDLPGLEQESEVGDSASEESDWLQSQAGSEEQPSPSPFHEPLDAQADDGPETGDLPDWMSDLSDFEPLSGDAAYSEAKIEESSKTTPSVEETFTASEGTEVNSEEETEQPTVESVDEQDDEYLETVPFMLDDIPDWLSTYSSEEQAETPNGRPESPEDVEDEGQPQPHPPFAADDLTEWVTPQPDDREQLPEEPAISRSKDADEDPIPAQLPGWVEAMRPVESVLSNDEARLESDQRIERSGPLAGIPGTIPGEDLATRYHKPPVYSSKLQVTEKQRLHANLLEAMIAETDEPVTSEQEHRSRPSALPRLLIALLIIAALSYVLLTGGLQLPAPNLYPFEAAAFQSTLQSVTVESQQPVLVIVDYQPAFSAELEAVAASPLQEIAFSGVNLAFVSTSPTGPVLSTRLIENLAEQNSSFNPTGQALNLGYLAGGSTGMQAFSLQPSLALLSTFEGQDAWGDPMLNSIRTLDDFGAILILTDTVENGRDWIEQVQPSLVNTPMLMVTSAQSAPLLQPYVNSGQLSGLLAGWYGGVSYDIIDNNPVVFEARSWTAYQIGIVLMVAIILIGVLIQGVVDLLSARKKVSGA